jgi:transketolase
MALSTTPSPLDLDDLCINTLRFLTVDMVQNANSGHPGLPLGSAAMAYTLWDRFLKVNPLDPQWLDRDRFVLSPGHGAIASAPPPPGAIVMHEFGFTIENVSQRVGSLLQRGKDKR